MIFITPHIQFSKGIKLKGYINHELVDTTAKKPTNLDTAFELFREIIVEYHHQHQEEICTVCRKKI